MKTLTSFLTIALLLLAGMSLPGCGGSDSQNNSATNANKDYLVIFSQCNNAEPYRAAQNAMMTKLWADKGIKVQIMDAQQSNSNQIAQIETAIQRQPDLLIVAPNERGPLTSIMGKAMDAGIPVICLERDIEKPNFTTFVGSNNYDIGKLVGEFIVKHLEEKNGKPAGNVVHLRGLLAVEAEMERYNGAQDVIKEHPDIKVVADPVANWLQSNARERMTEVLSVADKIDVVYGHNDPMAVGAYLAAQAEGRHKEMIFVGVDGLGGAAGGIQKVKDGVLAATFVYPLCVEKAVEVGHKIITDPDFKPEKTYMIESTMVTPENADEWLEKTKDQIAK